MNRLIFKTKPLLTKRYQYLLTRKHFCVKPEEKTHRVIYKSKLMTKKQAEQFKCNKSIIVENQFDMKIKSAKEMDVLKQIEKKVSDTKTTADWLVFFSTLTIFNISLLGSRI